jgi:dipeptidyl aminopeptidase/acylaminoacyl peptidase
VVLRKVLLGAGIALGLLLALVAAFAMLFSRTAMRVPRRAVTVPVGVPLDPRALRTVRIRAQDGITLDAWWIQPAIRHEACVIVLHGIGDSRTGSVGFAPIFLHAGYAVLLPDSRAHGESGGELVTYGLRERQDVIRWTSWLRSAGCSRIYGLGESFGGATLIQASPLELVFRALAVESAYSDLRSAAQYRLSAAMGPSVPFRDALARGLIASTLLFARLRYGFDFDRDSPLHAMAQTRTPILLIHGTADTQTPPSHSVALAAASPRARLWLVPGAGHCGAAAAAPHEFRDRILSWFAEHEPPRTLPERIPRPHRQNP